MFGFLRLFSFIGLFAVIAVAWVGGAFFKTQEMERMTRIAEQNNVGLAQGYVESVWKKYRDTIVPVSTTDPSQLATHPDVPRFAQDTLQYFQALPLARVNIYNSSGLLLMSVTPDAAKGRLAAAPPSPAGDFVIRQLSRPTPASALLGNEGLLQTVAPVRIPGQSGNDGALEVLYDVRDSLKQIQEFHDYGVGGFVATFVVFFLAMFIMSKQAENIIARQHEGNLELATAAAAAQAESRDKSQFLANVSHELRTPLNAIIGFSEILRTEAAPLIQEKKYHDYINDIHGSGSHLLSLINDILDFSKAEAGKLELEVSEVNVTKLVQNTMRLLSQRAEAAGISLTESLPKEAIVMVTDSKKFRQILLNLLSNAIKFTRADGEVRITAWRNVGEDTYAFEVKDTGIGIAPKDISRAMTPFGQVDSTLSRKYEGTGLGLPLTKKFVELMGGKFTIESKVDVGTTITFTVPREIKERDGVIIKRQEA